MQSGRVGDVPEQKRTKAGCVVALIGIVFFIVFSPILEVFVMLWEKATVKEFFITPVATVESPDGKSQLTVSREGVFQLVEKKTGKVLKTAKLSPKRYTTLDVTWKTPQKIEIFARYRYAALARGESLQWDLETGKLQVRDYNGTLTEPETE